MLFFGCDKIAYLRQHTEKECIENIMVLRGVGVHYGKDAQLQATGTVARAGS